MDHTDTPPTQMCQRQSGAEPSGYQHCYDASSTTAAEGSYFSAAIRRPKPLGLRDLGVMLNNKRRGTFQQPIRGAATAWIDQDDSGTYDPKADRATPPGTQPRRRKRPRLAEEVDEDGVPRQRTAKPHRAVGYSFRPFNSPSRTPDHEPSDSPLDRENDAGFGLYAQRRKTRRPKRLLETPLRDDGLTIDQLTIGHPQRRGCKSCFLASDDACSLIDHRHDYPCTACEDAGIDCELIIQPALKKVCERCRKKRIVCSYRTNGGKGVDSCEACEEADVTCFAAPLTTSAVSKRFDPALSRPGKQTRPTSSPVPPAPRTCVSCNQCRSKGLKCSLRRDQPGPCGNCRKEDEDCAFLVVSASAGPLPPPQAATKSKAQMKKIPPKKHQSSKARSPYQEYDEEGFPTAKYLNDILMTESYHAGFGKKRQATLIKEFERSSRPKKTKKQQRSCQQVRRRPCSAETPDWPKLLGISAGIRHIRIKTAFCHPIKFNYIPDPLGRSPCSWCISPFFGLFGHGEIEVEVVPYPNVDGNGYEEMPGGHAETGAPGSQMCVDCTFERVKIMGCERHNIDKIDVDPRVSKSGEIEKSANALLNGDAVGGRLALGTKWCSICPRPAFFKCCTRLVDSLVESTQLGVGSSGGEGCGLFLCQTCEDLMKKLYGGGIRGSAVLDRLVREGERNGWAYEQGIRADASFLTSSGELMVRIQKGMGEGGEEDGDEVVLTVEGEQGHDEIEWTVDKVGKGTGKGMEMDRNASVWHKPIKSESRVHIKCGVATRRNPTKVV